MRNILILMLSMICLSGIFVNQAFSCTMVMVAKDDVVLAGNNEDWKNPGTMMWLYPASKSEYGRVCFGFDDGFTQGGMNDRGLFIDGNALAPTGWKSSPGKPYFHGNLMDHILAHCATVDEAANFFKKYNFPSLKRAKFPVADAQGDSAVIEWGQGKVQILKRSGIYQISTNFVQSNYSQKKYPCARYKMAEKILTAADRVSIDLVRSVLSATHSEYSYPTLYSNIYDLKNKKVYLYNFHNFEEVVVIDLIKELKKGKMSYKIPDLFFIKTQAARLFERHLQKTK